MKVKTTVYYTVALLLILVIIGAVGAPRIEKNRSYKVDRVSGPFRKAIITDKETYSLGEKVEARFMFFNEASHPIFINPITFYSISVCE